jgi:hypothetical protein
VRQNTSVSKEFAFQLLKCLSPSVLEILKGPPESESSCAAEWPKDHCQGIELAGLTKVVEGNASKRKIPLLALRPIQDDRSFMNAWQKVRLDIVVPEWAVRVHEEDIATASAPPLPDR